MTRPINWEIFFKVSSKGICFSSFCQHRNLFLCSLWQRKLAVMVFSESKAYSSLVQPWCRNVHYQYCHYYHQCNTAEHSSDIFIVGFEQILLIGSNGYCREKRMIKIFWERFHFSMVLCCYLIVLELNPCSM